MTGTGRSDQPPPTETDPRSAGIRRRLLVVLVATVLVMTVPLAFFTTRAIARTTDEIETARLRLAALAAAHADRELTEAFYEIELMLAGRSTQVAGENAAVPDSPLRSILQEASSFRTGALLLDATGRVTYWEPSEIGDELNRSPIVEVLNAAAASEDRAVSEPFVDPGSGRVVSALSLPLFDAGGARQGTIVGLFDLSGPLITDLVAPALDLGPSGHSDLVDEQGRVITAVNPAHGPQTGHHPGFYRGVAARRAPTVESVLHQPGATELDRSPRHVMAYVPLRMAPWGVAIGASEEDTMQSVDELRRDMIVLGASAAAALLAGLSLAAYTGRRGRPSAEADSVPPTG
jgi:hypothetical protein